MPIETAAPASVIRLSEGAPSAPGAYVHVAELASWLRGIGEGEIARAVEQLEHFAPTEQLFLGWPA